ncbi:hypothetical protein JQ617_08065 [Bradyrhizobium sp. KB893862 SZCCT0404]|uniref:hypothetical protein n=1 Tax=Bradyrhizobium sp. KB893862 SZCCT0404 TaxID=2807672 RepID=UPI001BA94B67|nr:hypothetical protein [Bradyrhizobium sp. KB893862 SZCCT0404]MBR1173905.1 hypothetical protein [Bradyrhizobium sp. KB893862 SZCCT0404]
MLIALEWALKNWKVVAMAAFVLTASGFLWKAGYQYRAARDAAAQVKVLQGRLDAEQRATSAYRSQFLKDHAELSELKRRASETPPNSGPCLDRDASRRVRSIH